MALLNERTDTSAQKRASVGEAQDRRPQDLPPRIEPHMPRVEQAAAALEAAADAQAPRPAQRHAAPAPARPSGSGWSVFVGAIIAAAALKELIRRLSEGPIAPPQIKRVDGFFALALVARGLKRLGDWVLGVRASPL